MREKEKNIIKRASALAFSMLLAISGIPFGVNTAKATDPQYNYSHELYDTPLLMGTNVKASDIAWTRPVTYVPGAVTTTNTFVGAGYTSPTGNVKFAFFNDTLGLGTLTAELTPGVDESVYTFAYSGANTAYVDNSTSAKLYLGATVFDSSNNIVAQGQLKAISDTGSDTGITLTIPKDMMTGNTLALYEEQISGETGGFSDSDYVSSMTLISLKSLYVAMKPGAKLDQNTTYTKSNIGDVVSVSFSGNPLSMSNDKLFFLPTETWMGLAESDKTLANLNSMATAGTANHYVSPFDDPTATPALTFVYFPGAGDDHLTAQLGDVYDVEVGKGKWYQEAISGITWYFQVDQDGTAINLWTRATDLSAIIDGNGTLNLPDTISGIPIKSIGGGTNISPVVPSSVDTYSGVNLPATATTINKEAFYGSLAPAKINITDKVTRIGERAFYGSSIGEVSFMNAITTVDQEAFAQTKYLEKIVLKGVDVGGQLTIGQNAFEGTGTDFERSVLITGNVSVGKNAFYGANISDITINSGSGTVKLDDSAFITSHARTLIASGDVNIGNNAFKQNESLTSVEFDGSNVIINDSAFNGCTALTDITFNGTAQIGAYAFANDTALTEVLIPATVTSVGNQAFFGCTEIITVDYNAKRLGNQAFASCPSIQAVILRENVERVEWNWNSGINKTRAVYVKDANTIIETHKDGATYESAFGNNGDVTVYYEDNTAANNSTASLSVETLELKATAYARNYQKYLAFSQGGANSITFIGGAYDADDNLTTKTKYDMANKTGVNAPGSVKINGVIAIDVDKIQTSIAAYYTGVPLYEGRAVNKDDLAVYAMYGTTERKMYDSSEFFIMRSDEFEHVKDQHNGDTDAIYDAVLAGEPVTITAADIGARESTTLSISVIVFSDEGEGAGYDPANKLFFTDVRIRLNQYNADVDAITTYGTYAALMKQITTLQSQVSALKLQILTAAQDIAELNQEIADKDAEIVAKKAELAAATTDEERARIQAEIDQLMADKTALQAQVSKLKTLQAEAEEAKARLQAEIASLTNQIAADQTALEAKEADLAAATTDEERALIQAEIDKLKAKILQAQRDKAAAEAELNAYNTSSAENQAALAELAEAKKKLVEYEGQLATLNEALLKYRTENPDNGAGYTGLVDGHNMVYINGEGYQYEGEGEHIQVLTEAGVSQGSGTVYSATEKAGEDLNGDGIEGGEFEFYVAPDGVHVLPTDWRNHLEQYTDLGPTDGLRKNIGTVYTDTLGAAIRAATEALNKTNQDLATATTSLEKHQEMLETIAGEGGLNVDLTGKTEEQQIAAIKDAVADLISEYNDVKQDYADIKTAIGAGDEVDQTAVLATITGMKETTEQAQTVYDMIDDVLATSDLSDEQKAALDTLQKRVQFLINNMGTDTDALTAIQAALGTSGLSQEETETAIRNLVNENGSNKTTINNVKDALTGNYTGTDDATAKSVQDLYTDNANKQRQLDEKDGQLEAANASINGMKDTLKGVTDALGLEETASKDAIVGMVTTLANENPDVTQLEQDKAALQTQVDNLTTQNTNLQTKVEDLERQIAEGTTDPDAKATIADLRKQVEDLTAENKELRNSAGTGTPTETQIKASALYKTLETQNATLTSTNNKLEKQVDTLQTKNDTLTADKASLTTQVSNLTAENKSLTSENKTLTSANNTLTSENKTLTSTNATLKSENTTLASANSTLQKENSALADKNADLKEDKKSLKSDNKSLEKQVDTLKNTNSTLQKSVSDAQSSEKFAKDSLSAVQGQVTALQNEKTTLSNQNTELAKQNAELSGENKTLSSQNSTLQSQANRNTANTGTTTNAASNTASTVEAKSTEEVEKKTVTEEKKKVVVATPAPAEVAADASTQASTSTQNVPDTMMPKDAMANSASNAISTEEAAKAEETEIAPEEPVKKGPSPLLPLAAAGAAVTVIGGGLFLTQTAAGKSLLAKITGKADVEGGMDDFEEFIDDEDISGDDVAATGA